MSLAEASKVPSYIIGGDFEARIEMRCCIGCVLLRSCANIWLLKQVGLLLTLGPNRSPSPYGPPGVFGDSVCCARGSDGLCMDLMQWSRQTSLP